MTTQAKKTNLLSPLRALFLKVGILPFFLVIAVILFSILSNRFLTGQNLINVARQSVYLVLVSLGQMMVLISGGFDLSVGTTIALSSVVSALGMVWFISMFPDLIWFGVFFGIGSGMLVAMLVGLVNGVGVAKFEVSPFILTLGGSSVTAG